MIEKVVHYKDKEDNLHKTYEEALKANIFIDYRDRFIEMLGDVHKYMSSNTLVGNMNQKNFMEFIYSNRRLVAEFVNSLDKLETKKPNNDIYTQWR